MSHRRRSPEPVLITDAAPSFDDQLRSRRRRYATLMAVHIAGFALAGALYYVAWWLGLVLMAATGALPWIAVIAANDSAPREPARAKRGPRSTALPGSARPCWSSGAGPRPERTAPAER